MNLPCQSGDPNRWFPTVGTSPKKVEAVKAECRDCPLRESCLDWALLHGEQGIWSGTSEKERGQIRRARNITVQPVHVSIHEDRAEVVRSMVARGMNGPQIAAALGISPSGAAQAINRVRAKRNAS